MCRIAHGGRQTRELCNQAKETNRNLGPLIKHMELCNVAGGLTGYTLFSWVGPPS
jgi:hypothetical protein